ncbi:3-keto-5-aminohexanoate cleavage protein [Candidatus Epulonipiscium fishelsonii]|uniref:3-keto-5-aminohexanoate cleavage protein n=1 Tax=Candidatus Epulonipiscium fishelsonii TaxID=77094 RepID=A0ACC8X9N0_9FIRM|nr:3-keto-5-aminohexanoate cleavage protein [Epulopiscium sp. SCG-B05WGA-EpuloA1]ONI38783.1 3-keto-5-aminohexanoate cleavage protein [Epulopiscium sp. SCG-B11WGA-EpuloA1]
MKTMITVAPTGAWPTKEHNPNIPMTPQEIAKDVYECWKAGAAICHLHMRDDKGKGTMSTDKFTETVNLIREYKDCDIIINLTTSGDLNATDETRQAHLKALHPDMASYDCGSMNWGHNSLFINHPKFLEELGKTMQECNIKPEIEIFDAGMIYNSEYYLKKGVLKAPCHYQLVLGAAGGSTATVENLVYLKGLLPKDATWGALGIGKGHVPIMLTAVAMGGHLRVGMEDNVFFAPKVLAKSNAQLVTRAADIIRIAGNEVATPNDAREILGLKK